jgi:hypothetical protein
MARRFAEQVYVRQAAPAPESAPAERVPAGPAPQPPGAPEAFVWRDRLYVVREVLDHWRERTAWWRADVALAVHGDLPDLDSGPDSDPDRGVQPDMEAEALTPVHGHEHEQDHDPAAAVARSAARAAAIGRERQVWRVEASPGMAHAQGVYDLCHDLVVDPDRPPGHPHDAGAGAARGTWRLLRVAD